MKAYPRHIALTEEAYWQAKELKTMLRASTWEEYFAKQYAIAKAAKKNPY